MLEALKKFEIMADDAIGELPLLTLPARAVLAGLHYIVFFGTHGRQFGGRVHADVGQAILQRLSAALPLIRHLQVEPFGEGAEDAICAFMETDPTGAQQSQLLAYLHFANLMPEVHRNYFAIDTIEHGFRLRNRDDEFGDWQAKDITLSEIAIPFSIAESSEVEAEFCRLAETAPVIEWSFASHFIATNSHRYLHGLAEADIVTDTSLNHMLGFGRDRFLAIRSAVLAYAEFCDKLATTIHALVHAGHLPQERLSEGLEWVSVNNNAEWLFGLLAAASQSAPADVERFLELYTIDFRRSPAHSWGGDGYFPPFARFQQSVLFSPLQVLSFLQVRNAVFAFSKKDQKVFDNDVSQELEPVLLHQASELLERGGEWNAVKSVAFPGGEIDLLVACPHDDAVLLIQAKGNLPPQGARLTERLSGRVREGLRQIERFAALEKDCQQRVIEQALHRKVGRLDIRHAILARSCFGAVEVFSTNFVHVRLTLPLLSLALEHLRREGMPTTISALVQAIEQTSNRIFKEAGPYWEEGEIILADTHIQMPLLKWTPGSLDKLRQESWSAAIRPKR